MSFGEIINAWIREQVEKGNLPNEFEADCTSRNDFSSLTDCLCDAIRTAQDDTPIRLLAAHFGYELKPFSQGCGSVPTGCDVGETIERTSQNIHC